MLPEKRRAACEVFHDSARHDEILPAKTTLMLHLAAAIAFGCDP